MKVLAVILPVLTMIILGFACRKTGVISKDCVNGLKFLASKVMLPVSVFHALATASLDGGTVIQEIIILAMLVLTFGAGFFMRRFMKEPYKRYIPFMVCVYEGGMLAYPLYTSICGISGTYCDYGHCRYPVWLQRQEILILPSRIWSHPDCLH